MPIFVPVFVDKEYKGSVALFGEPLVKVNGGALRHVDFHCPDGEFDWGNNGFGAADLALSILADYFEEWWVTGQFIREMKNDSVVPKCWEYHQAFKRFFCSHWKKQIGPCWDLSSLEISMFLVLAGYHAMLIVEIDKLADTDTQP